jgi:hypothetical protein
MENLFEVAIETAKSKEFVMEKHFERVNVEATVLEKAVAFPTEGRFYHKARRILVRVAKNTALPFARSMSGYANVPSSCRVVSALPDRQIGLNGRSIWKKRN